MHATEDKWERSFDYPVFCFKHLHRDFHLDLCDSDDRIAILNKIVLLSTLRWQEIQTSGRHGLGSEKIAVGSIKASRPAFLTPDVDFLLALRFNGRKPMVGHRNKFIFHILYFDRNFTLYDH